MYLPHHFEETRKEILYDLMRAHPFATLTTITANEITANHIPLLFREKASGLDILEGHIARANPLWKSTDAENALVIFQGPHGYITPNWYPTKQVAGKVVPTWNYAIVHAKVRLRFVDDADWLKTHLEKLTASQESNLPTPWSFSDAPQEYTDRLITALIGIELDITELTGKWKMSQNQPLENQQGIVNGLAERNTTDDHKMAEIIAKTNRLST